MIKKKIKKNCWKNRKNSKSKNSSISPSAVRRQKRGRKNCLKICIPKNPTIKEKKVVCSVRLKKNYKN